MDWYTWFGEQENFMRDVLNKPFPLINVSQYEKTQLHQHLWAGAFELVFKYRLRKHLNTDNIDQ